MHLTWSEVVDTRCTFLYLTCSVVLDTIIYISIFYFFMSSRHHIYIYVLTCLVVSDIGCTCLSLTCSVVLDTTCTFMYLTNRIGGRIKFFISSTYTTNTGSKATNKFILYCLFGL